MAVNAAIRMALEGEELAEVVAGVANAGGGRLTYPAEYRKGLEVVISAIKMISPRIIPVVMPVNGATAIMVPDGPEKPYMVAGKFPIYRNEDIEFMGVKEVERLIMEKWLAPTFDARILDFLSVDALNLHLVEEFASHFEEKWPLKLIERMGLVRGGKPTVAALIMFGSVPEAYLPQCEIKVTRRKPSPDRGILTSRSFLGPIMEKFGHLMDYLLTESNQMFDRKKVRCFRECIEEVIVNAIVHRDYSLPALLEISISEEGLTVFSPGVPPIEPFPANGGFMPSMPRNPLLRRAMYASGIAKPYPGLALLKAKAGECGVEDIRVESQMGGILTVLPIGRKIVDLERLNPRQRELYKYLTRHRVITRKEYEQMMQISERTARLDLEEMVKAGILKRQGRGKQIKYVLNV